MTNYPHQERVADLVLRGKNVILQAPTGAGKTRAALLPFLEALNPDSDAYGYMPSRCIYSVPMRILANQFVVEYGKTVKSYATRYNLGETNVTIQTGEHQGDRQLEGDLIFATIDQTLSSYLMRPYSLSGNRGNINAGAVISSYLVFDEFHLFDPDSTLPTTLLMLKKLQGITPFVLMTATFSASMLEYLAEFLDAEIVGQASTEREAFQRLVSQDKARYYHTVQTSMNADAVLEHHDKRTLVIANTVNRARRLFLDIQSRVDADTEVLLLHSRLLPQHRQKVEDEIQTKFGRDDDGDGRYIVVSTQAIEVGVDMTSTNLHTELAPANSIIQRAGRCARYKGETGHVYIYKTVDTDDDEPLDLTENPMPYNNGDNVIAETWQAFDKRDDSVPYTYDDEQAIISTAHKAQDERISRELKAGEYDHQRKLFAVQAYDADADSKAADLVRKVIAQAVTIHENPDEIAQAPFAYPSFSLHPATVQAILKDWIDVRRNDERQVCVIRRNDDEDDAQQNETRYIAESLHDARGGWMAELIVVHPDLATYDEILGFITEYGYSDGWQAEKPQDSDDNSDRRNYSYRLETYERHIDLVYQAFQEQWQEVAWVARRIEQIQEWAQNSIYRAAQLTVLLHDVGKLSRRWQGWIREYQTHLAELEDDDTSRPQAGMVYAHTDKKHDINWQEAEKRTTGNRGWHAVEGAVAIARVLADTLQNPILLKASLSAIARHHTPKSDNYQTFQLEADAAQHIANTLPDDIRLNLDALNGVEQAIRAHTIPTKSLMAVPHEGMIFLTYQLLVRVLRRADSAGTKKGADKISTLYG